MSQIHWERVADLFAEAVRLDGEARRAFLDAAGGGDAGLVAEVESLLEADNAAGPLDDLQQAISGPGVARLAEGPRPGDQVGPYRIVRKLGEGGMGTVYEAERADPELRQRVALKLVRVGFGRRDLLDRFVVERQILARLEHPNIARFLDGGLTHDALPYLAMEYVEGTRIDQYCDVHHFSVRARLGLFHEVCEAVQYAHQHLIVHRDVKPDNILVTAEGRAKLLDFGIAKLLPASPPDGPGAGGSGTRTEHRRLTPEYASPEQVRGEAITPASDVYSLGVLLYRLLTGTSPYRTQRDLPHELERAICELEPDKPSVAVARRGGEARRAAKRRGRALAGDLDTIALKALRKDPAARYATAGQVAEEIGRHLTGLPIRARPDTLAYRAGKFARRHRVGVAAAGVVLLSLVAGLGLAVRGAAVAAAERDGARTEAEKATQVSEFLVGLFQAADPTVALGADVTALELLERGTARLTDSGELRSQPGVRAAMLHVIGRVYLRLGRYERAAELGQQALSLREEVFGPVSVEAAETLDLLGRVSHSRGDQDVAEDYLLRAVAISRRFLDESHPQVVSSLYGLALTWQVRGNYRAADSLWTALLAVQRSRFGEPSPQVAEVLHNLGWANASQGKPAAAEAAFREALTMRRILYGDVHPDLAHTNVGLSRVLQDLGRLDEAERLAREAVAIQIVVLGQGHPDLADAYIELGGVLKKRGAVDSAEAYYRLGLAHLRAAFGERDVRVARILNDFAGVFEQRGDLFGADSLYRQAWSVYGTELGQDHPFTALVLANVASVARQRGDLATAERLFTQVLDQLRSTLGAEHVEAAAMSARLGYVKMERGDYEGAERFLDTALTLLERQLPSNRLRVARTLEAFVALYQRWGKDSLAASYRSRLEAARSDSLSGAAPSRPPSPL